MSHLAVLGFVYLFCIKLSNSAPVTSETFLDEFIAEMKTNKCLLPKEVQLPGQTTETLEVDAFSSHLQSCSTPKKQLPKTSLKLCEKVFALLRSIACTQSLTALPEIKVEFSTQICADFNAIADSVPDDGLLKHLSDPFFCDFTCSDINNATCQMLLWSYQVDKSITDAVSQEKLKSKNGAILNEVDSLDKKQSQPSIVDKTDTQAQILQESLVDEKPENPNDLEKKIELPPIKLQTDSEVKPEDRDVKPEEQDAKDTDPNLVAEDPNVKAQEDDTKATDQMLRPEEETEIVDDNLQHIDGKISDPTEPKSQPIENGITHPNEGTDPHDETDLAKTVDEKQQTKLTDEGTNPHDKTDPAKNVEEKKQTKITDDHVLGVKTLNPQTTSGVSTSAKSVAPIAHEDLEPHIANKELKDVVKEGQTPTRKETTVPVEKPTDKKTLPSVPQKESDSAKQTPQVTGKSDSTSVASTKKEQTVVKPKKEEAIDIESSSSSMPVSPALENMEGGEIPLPVEKDPDQYTDLENDGEEYPKGEYDVSLDEPKNKSPKTSIPQVPESKGSIINMRGGDEFSMREQPYRRGHEDIQVIAAFPEQEDTHFFFYFLSIVLMLMAGYLIFHNKQKIIALIVEGRHERGRRRSHGASYKKLDTK